MPAMRCLPHSVGWRLRTFARMIFLAGSEVRSSRVCYQIRDRIRPFGSPSGCAERSKPPPIRLGSMQFAQPSASELRFRMTNGPISMRCSGRPMSLATPEKIRILQRKLYRKAKAEPAFRFYLLYDKIYREDIFRHAYALARANAGAPGTDGMTFAAIEASGLDRWLAGLRLAGAWTDPDPSDPSDLDLLTFAVFEGAFVCICAAYLFGGLAKDRIAARYRRVSLTDPLTGAANRRGFFERGERLLMRARFARQHHV